MATIDPSKLADGVQDTIKISVSPETEQAIQNAEGKDLEQQRFDLQLKIEEQNLKHRDTDFKQMYVFKYGAVLLSLLYLAFASCLLVKTAHDYADSENWHIPLAIVVGSFTTSFAIFAVLLKGIFSKEKASGSEAAPISLSELLKTIASAWRSSGSK
jgi:hypothetical protein